MKFRYDINALRAIAIIAVVGFHYNITGFSGGFCGVDVFFVISGYLMSQIIIDGIDNNKFSLFEFYGRRLKRIVPALLFMVFVVLLIDFFVYFPGDYRINEKNATAAMLFVSNILFWQQSSYFEKKFLVNEFLHTWSLSVEWQFYLLYPIALMLIRKVIKSKQSFLYFFIISTLLICGLSIAYTPGHENKSFYILPTRCWEMMFGGIAFLIEDKTKDLRYRKLISTVGYILILLSVVLLNSTNKWPGLLTLLPVLATFLIIASDNNFQLLRYEAIQFTGKISYSLYLWHWPVFIICSYLLIPAGYLLTCILIIVSFIAGYISFKFIESYKFKNSMSLLAIMIVFIICAGSMSCFDSNKGMFNASSIKIESYWQGKKSEVNKQFSQGCFITRDGSTVNDLDKQFCLPLSDSEKNILLIGDSHAADIAEALRQRLKKKNINLLVATASGCLPYVNSTGLSRCTNLINYFYKDFIVTNKKKLSGLILSGNWANNATDTLRVLHDVKNTIDYISKQGIPIIVIGQNDLYTVPYPLIAALSIERNRDEKQYFVDNTALVTNNFLSKVFRGRYINIYNSTGSSQISAGLVPYMFDEDHFTGYGSELIADKILSDSTTINFITKSSK